MFQFHSIPLLTHLRSPHRRAMSTPSVAPPTIDGAPPTTPFRFLDLPLELREQIYGLYFAPADRLRKSATLEREGVEYPLGDIHFDVGGIKIGFEICEDAWVPNRPGVELYEVGAQM